MSEVCMKCIVCVKIQLVMLNRFSFRLKLFHSVKCVGSVILSCVSSKHTAQVLSFQSTAQVLFLASMSPSLLSVKRICPGACYALLWHREARAFFFPKIQ